MNIVLISVWYSDFYRSGTVEDLHLTSPNKKVLNFNYNLEDVLNIPPDDSQTAPKHKAHSTNDSKI